MTFAVLKWLTVALSLWGTVLNVRHDRRCFYLWLVSNGAWCVIDLIHGVYQQSLLHAVYLGLAIYGLAKWRAER